MCGVNKKPSQDNWDLKKQTKNHIKYQVINYIHALALSKNICTGQKQHKQ